MNRLRAVERLESRRLLARRGIVETSVDVTEELEIAAAAQIAPAALSVGDSINLMVIGDSISSGISQADFNVQNNNNGTNYPARDSYRTEIWDLIQSEFTTPPDVTFVGSSMYNSSGLPTEAKAHSAYRGYESGSFFPSRTDPEGTVNNSNANADGWGTFVVDVALIQLGTNDVFNGRALSSLEDDLQDIVEVFRNDNPDVQILIGTLPPYINRQNAGNIPAANVMISDLVNPDAASGWTGSTASSPITIIDHYNGEGGNAAFDASLHTADGLHPNPDGEDLLASNWWTGLFPILNSVVQPPPPPTVTLTAPTATMSPAVFPNTNLGTEMTTLIEGVGPVNLVVTRSGADNTDPLTVKYSVSGSATNGTDYSLLSGEVIIPGGADSANIVLSVTQDSTPESTENIVITLTEDLSYQLAGTVSVDYTVWDDDPTPAPTSISVSAVVDSIDESSTSTSAFMISRDGDATEDVVVKYSVSGSTTPAVDYQGLSGSVTIPRGSTSVMVNVDPKDDQDTEGNETIVLEVEKTADYVVTKKKQSSIEILDNDAPPADPVVSILAVAGPASEDDETISFLLSRTGDLSEELVVKVDWSGTANKGRDYVPIDRKVVIPAGESSAAIDIAIIDDFLVEGDETLIAEIKPEKGFEIAAGVAEAVIQDNDPELDLQALLMQAMSNGRSKGSSMAFKVR